VAPVLLTYLIAARLWGARAALLAGAIAAVFPPLVFLSVSLLSELLFVPLALASVLAVLRYRDDRRLRWAALAGALCGLAVLTRTNGLPLVLALAAGVWVTRPWRSRAALAAPAVVVLAAVLVLAPWVVRNAVVFDRFVGLGTGAGYALAGTYNAEARDRAQHPGEPFAPNVLRTYEDDLAKRGLDEAELIGRLNDQATAYVRDHPGYVVETMLWNVPRVFDLERRGEFEPTFAAQQVQAKGMGPIDSPVVFLGSLYVVLALGIGGAAVVIRRRATPAFVWAAPVLLLLPALAIYGLPRYRAPADPFLVMLAALSVAAAYERLTASRARG
jgi:4-amino-4-deoxy-L-arabinose transferase-like glycosyltransferase